MKYFVITLFALTVSLSFIGCSKDDDPAITDPVSNNKLKITIGSSTFTATLYENATTSSFKALLPLTLNMSELNGNEKLYDFSNSLPSNTANPGTIQNGDIMLYGSRTLVLFYKTFSTSYSYTRIGKVDDISGYAASLGAGNVSVTFEMD
ncbi:MULTISPECIES: cyclophilin-like fold protein [unclassified Sphingobacterium]|uniref:cyclophilin-like fold protein n=1 Tax=unclassified Sphingobacterium TaxID=2609468 RepID=UPI0025E5328D|nr:MULTISPECIES: cyclophilin-like fold protein [unclassified Sphingobacterium]